MRPACSHKVNLVFLGDDNNVYLVQVGGKSITAVNRFLEGFTAKQLPTFAAHVTLRSEAQSSGKMKWKEVRGEVGDLVDTSTFMQLRVMRRGIMAQYSDHVSAAEERADAPPPPPPVEEDEVPF